MYNLPRPVSLVIYVLIVIGILLFCTGVTPTSCLATHRLFCLSRPCKVGALRPLGSRSHLSKQINLKGLLHVLQCLQLLLPDL